MEAFILPAPASLLQGKDEGSFEPRRCVRRLSHNSVASRRVSSCRCVAHSASSAPPHQDARLVCTWEHIEFLAQALAAKLPRYPPGLVVLAIARGGAIPATMLCELVETRTLLTASVKLYEDAGQKFYGLDQPTFLHFPEDSLLQQRNILIVDDVWDSGKTAASVRDRCRRAGASSVKVATLHYKPGATEFGAPDYFVTETDRWVVYPWETLAPSVKRYSEEAGDIYAT